eukprot:2980343-Amphidinium_carterae.1
MLCMRPCPIFHFGHHLFRDTIIQRSRLLLAFRVSSLAWACFNTSTCFSTERSSVTNSFDIDHSLWLDVLLRDRFSETIASRFGLGGVIDCIRAILVKQLDVAVAA